MIIMLSIILITSIKLMFSGMSIIITTHYIEEARDAHVVGIMRDGRLLAQVIGHLYCTEPVIMGMVYHRFTGECTHVLYRTGYYEYRIAQVSVHLFCTDPVIMSTVYLR